MQIAYPPRPENSPRVPVRIRHADGEEVVFVNQTGKLRAGRFDPIGTFRFEAGKSGRVTVETDGAAEGQVLADAVLFVPKFQPASQ